MDIKKRWHKFTKENVDTAPEVQGVYEIAYITSEGSKLWRIGKTPNLHTRLSTRLREPKPPDNCYFRYFEVGLPKDLDIIEGQLYDRYNRKPPPVPGE
jgi:hypothetical protein